MGIHTPIDANDPKLGSSNPFSPFLSHLLQTLFIHQWPAYIGATAVTLIALLLIASGSFWGVFGGVRLWGDWLNHLTGLADLLGMKAPGESIFMHRISLLNISLLAGSLVAALIAGQFALRHPPKLEYATGAIGGILMGIGAALAGGCTIGGFFTPLLFSSPAGWTMALGLTIGAIIGIRLLLWIAEHIDWGTRVPAHPVLLQASPLKQRIIGSALLLALLYWSYSWSSAVSSVLQQRADLILAGLAFGFILQRSRLCFSRVFREPFMTAEGEHTYAMIIALGLGVPAAAILIQRLQLDPYLGIPATFWIGSLLGGTIFGIGMVLAGGCATGSLWRMGEGHLKLWVAMLFFAWSGSTFSAIVSRWSLLTPEMNLDLIEVTRVGQQAYLPDLLGGWGWTLALTVLILLCWYWLIRYNERTQKFTQF